MPVSERVRFKVLARDRFRCVYCGRDASMSVLHVDHVIPSSRGGPDHPLNLATSCEKCNRGKSAAMLPAAELRAILLDVAVAEGDDDLAAMHEAAWDEASNERLNRQLRLILTGVAQ